MKLTRMIAVLGSFGVVLCASFTTWFVTPLGVEVHGLDLALGQGVLAAGTFGGVLAMLALVLRKRALSAAALACGLAAGAGLGASWLALDLHATVAGGFWLTLACAGAVAAAAIADLGAVRAGAGSLLRVSVLWNGVAVRSVLLPEPRDLDVGPDAKSGLVLPDGALAPRFPMFRAHAVSGGYDLCLPAGVEGASVLGGVRMTAADAAADGRVRLTLGDWGKLDFGETSLLFQLVAAGRRRERQPFAIDLGAPASVSLAAALVLGSVAMLTSLYNPAYAAYALPRQTPKAVSIDPSLLLREEALREEDVGKSEDTEAKAAEGDMGKFGDPDVAPDKVTKVPKSPGKLVSHVDPKRVGLVDVLASQQLQMGAMANILAPNAESLTSKLAVAMEGAGSDFQLGAGSGGMAFRGTGTGGGDNGPFGRILAIGHIDTGGGDRGGLGALAHPGKKPTAPVSPIHIGTGTSAGGFCSPADIAQAVRRRAAAIRACYEERLQALPTLAGKLSVRWTIGMDGQVQQAMVGSSTLADGGVGECVLRTIRRMSFTRPKDGVCVVQWPFVFSGGR